MERYINCESYNYGSLGSGVVVGTIHNSNDKFTTYVDSVNRADKIDENRSAKLKLDKMENVIIKFKNAPIGARFHFIGNDETKDV